MIEFSWEDDPVIVFSSMTDDYVLQIKAVIRAILMRFAPDIEAWMKENALWEDRTGNARQTLYALFEETANDLSIIADYKMWYGVFLELSNAAQYAVVAPAIDQFRGRIMAALRQALGE